MTDHARLRALCDAAIKRSQMEAVTISCDPATIRSLLDAKEERDILRAEVAIWTERTQIVAGDRSLIEAAEWADARWADAIAERDALRAAAEQAREAARHFVDKVDRGEARSVHSYNEFTVALAALDAVLKEKS